MIKEALPEGWEIVTLGEVADYLNGRAFKPTEWESSGIPIIRIQNLNNHEAKFNYASTEFENRYKVEKNDLLFAWSASLGAYIWKGNQAWLNQHIFKVVPKSNCDKKFLFYTLDKMVTELYSKTHGSGMVHVTKGKFEATEILLLPLLEQHLIVEKIEELFSELDKSLENLKTAQQQLKVYRQAVLKWAFEGKLTNEEVKDGELPEGWELVKLGKLAKSIRSGTGIVPTNTISAYPILRSSSVRNRKINFADIKYIDSSEKLKKEDFLQKDDLLFTRLNGSVDYVGNCAKIPAIYPDNLVYPDRVFRLQLLRPEYADYVMYFFSSNAVRKKITNCAKSSAGHMRISTPDITEIDVSICSFEEQKQIVQEIESRLSVCDKMEETITTSLQQAEALRQSILKKAFEGKLIKPQVKPAYKPKNVYFYQMQVLGQIAAASKEKGISHGEMTIAKYAYLVDKIYQIPTYYNYKRWHLGPYPPEIKKAINNSKFFSKNSNGIEVTDIETLDKYPNPYTDQLQNAIDDLSNIFLPYQSKNRSHQIELLATVCKVIEDIQTTDLEAVRSSMVEWLIDLPTTHFKSKAEKFSEEETNICLKMIVERGWIDKLIVK